MRFWDKITNGIRRFLNGLREVLDDHAATAVAFVQWVKQATESPVADVLVSLTETKIDDRALDWIRANINTILAELQLTAACAKKTTEEERIKCYLAQLAKLSEPVRNALYAKIASRVTQGLSGGRLTEAQADLAVAIEYATRTKRTPRTPAPQA